MIRNINNNEISRVSGRLGICVCKTAEYDCLVPNVPMYSESLAKCMYFCCHDAPISTQWKFAEKEEDFEKATFHPCPKNPPIDGI